jgi:hypothetical protein
MLAYDAATLEELDEATGAVLPLEEPETDEWPHGWLEDAEELVPPRRRRDPEDEPDWLYERRLVGVGATFATLEFIAPTTTLYAVKLWRVLPLIQASTLVVAPRLQSGNVTSIVPPSVSGDTYAGGVLRAWPGMWSGIPPFTFAYQWQRETAPSSGVFVDIPGATGSSYICRDDDVDLEIRVQVEVV